MGTVRAPVLCEPFGALAPLHAPEAVQDVALVDVHVNVLAPPLDTAAGRAVSATVAAPFTLTVAVETPLEPPGPLQVSE